jgi:hypothetical protein
VPVEREQPWIQAQMITAILWSAAAGVAANGFCDGFGVFDNCAPEKIDSSIYRKLSRLINELLSTNLSFCCHQEAASLKNQFA